MSGIKDLGDLSKWVYWYPLRHVVTRLPAGAVYALGRLAGLALARVAGGRRRHFEDVLPLVCPKADRALREQIVREAFVMLCQSEFEMLRYPVLNRTLIEAAVACRGLDLLDGSLTKGKGAMLLFAHFGANQMIMPALGFRGYTMCQMSAPSTMWLEVVPGRKYSAIERKGLEIRERNEQSLPVRHINVFGSLKEAFLCLKKNQILGVAIDGGGGKTREALGFLGRKALFSPGALEIALRTGCQVHPTFIVRSRRGSQTLIIEPALDLGGAGEPDAVRRAMARFVVRLEEYVYTYPDHYVNYLAVREYMTAQGDRPFFIP